MGTFSRIRYVMAANLNALVEKAENPEKLLRALIREMEDAADDARLAAADLLAEQQHLERLAGRLEGEMGEWNERAEKAVEAGRDDLARTALKARAELAESLDAARRDQEALSDRIAQLESDMKVLKGKLREAKQRLKEITASGVQRPAAAAGSESGRLRGPERRIRQAMSRFDRLQSQVERLEARVRSYEFGGPESSPWVQGDAEVDPVIEAELEALKARVRGPAAGAETANPDDGASQVSGTA